MKIPLTRISEKIYRVTACRLGAVYQYSVNYSARNLAKAGNSTRELWV